MMTIEAYPGEIIKTGSNNSDAIKSILKGLSAKGYTVPVENNKFDPLLKSTVKLFQSQNVDVFGRPLEVDGEVGSLTWEALFASTTVPAATNNIPATGEAAAALGVAISQIGVMEEPLGSNRGKIVDQYQTSAGLKLVSEKSPGFYWCMAFVYWCFEKAGDGTTSYPRTAGCIDAWNRVKSKYPNRIITRAAALANPSRIKPGMVFILDFGRGAGHTGFVKQSAAGALKTIEGNTNPTGSSNGLGVFELNRRKIIDPSLKGFIDFS